MPTPTYVAIAKATPTGSSVEFTGISNTYTDLFLVASLRTANATVDDYCQVQLGGITANNYTDRYVYGAGSTVTAGSGSSTNGFYYAIAACGSSATSNTFASSEMYIPNAFGSTNKPVSSTYAVENNSASSNTIRITAQLFSNTGQVTSIKIITSAGNFASGSRFDLYGIKNS